MMIINSPNFLKNYSIFFLYTIVSIQSIVILNFGGASLKPYHVLVGIWFFMVVMDGQRYKKNLSVLKWPFYLYFAYAIGTSLFNYLDVGVNSLVANYLFVAILFIVASVTYRSFSFCQVLAQLRAASWVIAAAMLINILISYENDGSNRIDLVFDVYGGGINLEATWVALACCFFIRKNKQFIVYFLLSVIVDYFMLSRAAFLITSMVFSYWVWINRKSINRKYICIALIFILVYLIYMFLGGEVGRPLVDRFLRIGSSGGGSGRENLWHFAALALGDRPFLGWGAGNAILASRMHGFGGPEDNVHNYLLQNYLDFGIIGMILWLVFFSSLFKNTFDKPELRCYLICFFISGFVQFRGAEPIFYLVAALLVSASVQELRPKLSKLNDDGNEDSPPR